MTARPRNNTGRMLALLALLATAALGCTDYVGDDLRAGEYPDDYAIRFEQAVSATTVPLAEPEPTDPTTLVAGDCFDDLEDPPLRAFNLGREVGKVPCGQAHRYELYAVIDIAAVPDEDWPGAAEVDERSDLACLAAFPEFIGTAWVDSSLDYLHLAPTLGGWGSGARQARCAVFDLGLVDLEDSAAASGR